MVFFVLFFQFSSVAQSCPSLRPHEPQHARPPCPTPTPGVHPNPCPSSGWCHPTISSSVVPFSSYPQSVPESGSFQMSQLFGSGGKSTGVSASTSVLPMNTQDWSRWNGWISLQSKGLKIIHSSVLSFFYSPFHRSTKEKETATHSSILAWRTLWTGEPGGLLSMGSHRVGHDWSDFSSSSRIDLPKYQCFQNM